MSKKKAYPKQADMSTAFKGHLLDFWLSSIHFILFFQYNF